MYEKGEGGGVVHSGLHNSGEKEDGWGPARQTGCGAFLLIIPLQTGIVCNPANPSGRWGLLLLLLLLLVGGCPDRWLSTLILCNLVYHFNSY